MKLFKLVMNNSTNLIVRKTSNLVVKRNVFSRKLEHDTACNTYFVLREFTF